MVMRRLDGLRIPIVLAGAATGVFYVALFVGQPLVSALLLRMPENYEYLAHRFLERRDYDRAIEACQREIADEVYNFHAHYLLADILRQAGRRSEALERLWNLPESYRAVRARTVPSRGWDEAYMHLLLARVLWDLRRPEEALDQLQVALDWHDPKITAQCGEFLSAIQDSVNAALAPWSYVARAIVDPTFALDRIPEEMASNHLSAPPNFYTRLAQIAANRQQIRTAYSLDNQEILHHGHELPSLLAHCLFSEQRNWPERKDLLNLYSELNQLTAGYFDFNKQTDLDRCLAEWYWAHLFQTTVTTGTAVLSRKSRVICIVARGTVCDGVWPILSIRISGKTIGQRYICSATFQAYTLPVELESGSHTIGVGFENDAVNPFLKRDRNLEIRQIYFY